MVKLFLLLVNNLLHRWNMIDAEKLLGKVLSGAMGSTGRKRNKSRRRNSDDLIGNLLGGLTSGKGLITAIGLGVGAYEILKNKSATTSPLASSPSGHTPTSLPPRPPSPGSQAPPPLPGQQQPPQPAAKNPARGEISPISEATTTQDLALQLIQIMVAAAHADGTLDPEEEKRILDKLQQDQGLDRDEKQFLLRQLHHPKTIDELVKGVDQTGHSPDNVHPCCLNNYNRYPRGAQMA